MFTFHSLHTSADKQSTEEGREQAHHIFSRIACAYELLSDPVKRRDYDEQQEEAEEEEHPGFDGNATYDYPMDPSRHAGSQEVANAGAKTGNPFNMFRRKKKKKPMHFHDPYEVFKRAFKDEFGYEYPGAKWDNIEKTGKDVHMAAKNAPLALENGAASGGGGGATAASAATDDGGKKNKGGGILTLFKGRKNKNDQALTVYKGDKNESANKTPPPGNNRPASMETKTTQIEHDDGTVETITETTITRPDGSTETMRQTDMPEKNTHNWTKPKEDTAPKKEHKLLTSGKEKQKMLTSGGGKKDKKKKEKPLAIKNG